MAASACTAALGLAAMLVAAPPVHAQSSVAATLPPAAEARCTLVYGHGRHFAEQAPRVNALWNDLNQGFSDAVAAELAAGGRRTVTLVLPVQSRDVSANVHRMLARAAADGCDEVVDCSVFGDPETELLIARVRLHAIVHRPGAPRADADLVVGPAAASVQRELPLNTRTLARLSSGELARQMATELRDPGLSTPSGALPADASTPR